MSLLHQGHGEGRALPPPDSQLASKVHGQKAGKKFLQSAKPLLGENFPVTSYRKSLDSGPLNWVGGSKIREGGSHGEGECL